LSGRYLAPGNTGIGGSGGGDVTMGTDGIGGAVMLGSGVMVLTGPGTDAPEETPRLPSSIEPKGIPVRGLPPGAVGDGVEDAIRLPEPDPHMPDIPAVSIVPEADCGIPEVVDIPEVVEIPDDVLGDAAVLPDAAPVAGVEFATESPPPS
jgi:hypothetical protein